MDQTGKQSDNLARSRSAAAETPLVYAPVRPPSNRWMIRGAVCFLSGAAGILLIRTLPEFWLRLQLAYWKRPCLAYINPAGLQPPPNLPACWTHLHALLAQPYPPVQASDAMIFCGPVKNDRGDDCLLTLEAPRKAINRQAECYDFLLTAASNVAPAQQVYSCGSSGLGTQADDIVGYSYASRDPEAPSHLTFTCQTKTHGEVLFDVWVNGGMIRIESRR